ncbi:hypothetical protein Pfo_002110, partial [Paulownia fortunei]
MVHSRPIIPSQTNFFFCAASRGELCSSANMLIPCAFQGQLHFTFLTFSPFCGAALAFYILSALFVDSFVIIFVVTVLLAALDFWVVKNVSGRILSLARMNKKDSWLFWWTLYLTAVAWIFFAIFSLIRFQADYLLVVGVCLTLSIANIVGFTRCRKGTSSFKHLLPRPLLLVSRLPFSQHLVLF